MFQGLDWVGIWLAFYQYEAQRTTPSPNTRAQTEPIFTRLLTLSSQNRLMRQLLPTPSAPIEMILIRTHWGQYDIEKGAPYRPCRPHVSENRARPACQGVRCVQQYIGAQMSQTMCRLVYHYDTATATAAGVV